MAKRLRVEIEGRDIQKQDDAKTYIETFNFMYQHGLINESILNDFPFVKENKEGFSKKLRKPILIQGSTNLWISTHSNTEPKYKNLKKVFDKYKINGSVDLIDGNFQVKNLSFNKPVVNIEKTNIKETYSTPVEKIPNMILKKPAVRVQQGDLTIYATSLKVKDLLIPQFYQVDKLDSSDESSGGFQRVLDKTRTKRLADYILKAWEDGDAFLPTSIFLATNKDVTFDEEKNEITFEIEKVCPFNVVDGQHRVEGLIEAARQKPEIKEFELVANIAVNLKEIAQMCHFLIVNTTQKSVNKAVEQQIIARLSGMVSFEEIPTLPKWIQNQVDKGEDKEALVITNYLNSENDSPWFQKIKMANKSKDGENTITQESFVQSIKNYILSSSNPLAGEKNIENRNKMLKNYWKAIDTLMINKNSKKDTVIYKTNGLELFNMISLTVFNKLYSEQNFTVDRIIEILQHGFNHLSNEYLEMQDPEWWESGNNNGGSVYNKGAIRHLATDLSRAINIQMSNNYFKI